MARKPKNSPFEDVLDAVSLLPWWAGVALAVASFFILGALAAPGPAVALTPQAVGGFVAHTLIRAFASVLQFVVPLLCLVAAVASALRRQARTSLVQTVVAGTAADKLDHITWPEFELLVGEAFRLDGFDVEVHGGAQPDGGVDLVLRRGGEEFLVQCKRWRAQKVGVDIVRELYGVMAARGATGGKRVSVNCFAKPPPSLPFQPLSVCKPRQCLSFGTVSRAYNDLR